MLLTNLFRFRVSNRRTCQLAGVASLVCCLGLGLSLSAGCVEQEEDKPTEEDLKIAKENILATAPTPKYAVNADLDGKVVYLGADVEPAEIEPGKETKVTHYWKMVASPGDGWKTFTHLEGPNRQNYINADHPTVKGKYPVSQWKAGEIIRDEHTIRLPASWGHKQLMIYVGLWRGSARLPVKSGPNDNEGRVLAATVPVKVQAKVEPRKRYVARMVKQGPKMDGKLDDAVWAQAASTGPFVNTMTGGPADQKTEAKLLWDNKYLYVAFDNSDTDIWSTLSKRDDKLWTEEAVELMIDADGNGKSYIEIQVAPNGTVFDTYLPEYRKYEDSLDPKKKQYSWNAKLNAKVNVDGTVTKRGDQDKGWTVELAIPLDDVKGLSAEGPKVPPTPGDSWRFNMFRLDAPAKGQQASAWSPPMVGDFHALDKFGDLVFGDDKGSIPATAPAKVAGAPMGAHGFPGAPRSKVPAGLVDKAEKGDKKSGAKAAGAKAAPSK